MAIPDAEERDSAASSSSSRAATITYAAGAGLQDLRPGIELYYVHILHRGTTPLRGRELRRVEEGAERRYIDPDQAWDRTLIVLMMQLEGVGFKMGIGRRRGECNSPPLSRGEPRTISSDTAAYRMVFALLFNASGGAPPATFIEGASMGAVTEQHSCFWEAAAASTIGVAAGEFASGRRPVAAAAAGATSTAEGVSADTRASV